MALKTEHAGAKKGNGAYWGRKAVAKAVSAKQRRADGKRATIAQPSPRPTR